MTFSRRRTVQSALAFALFPFTSLNQAQTMNTSLRPFKYRASDADLAELRRRIDAMKWPERETVTDDSQGVQLATIQALARYWGKDYDWRKVETKLNSYPQFLTEIDGLDIHFLHVRSKHEDALPLIVTHGWPGSVIEQMKIIEPLTNPTAHGGSASDAFHLVIPSMPGYGFSGKPTAPGWDPEHIARAWVVLMKRLGYKQVRRRKAAIGARSSPSSWARRQPRNCSPFIPTWPTRFLPTSTRRRSRARRRPPVSRPTRRPPTSACSSSTRRASATASSWGCGRRPCTPWRIRRSAWRPTSSTTTSAATG